VTPKAGGAQRPGPDDLDHCDTSLCWFCDVDHVIRRRRRSQRLVQLIIAHIISKLHLARPPRRVDVVRTEHWKGDRPNASSITGTIAHHSGACAAIHELMDVRRH